MKVILAEKAGFCFGVKRAVDTAFEKAEEAAASGRSIYSYGPVIHNEEVVKRLEDKGVKILNSLEDIVNIPKDSLIILRSHGVGKDVYETIEAAGHEYVDTTCPFVKNIHKIVDEKSKEGAAIILIGNPGHAEVEGTLGHCSGDAYVVDSEEDIRSLPDFKDRDIVVVEQTTYSLKKFKELVAVLHEIYYNVNVCKTICNATEERQNEAAELSKEVDSMIVIGGKTSSNTQKLYEISRQHCANTYYIQTLDDMDFTVLESASRVGITAGASTPNFIIKEVHDRMSELSFEEMLKNEENVSIRSGQVVDGVVVNVKPDEIAVNIGYKIDGIVTAAEYSNNPVDLTTVVNVNDPIKVKVLKVNESEGMVILSHKRVVAEQDTAALKEAFENNSVLKGTVSKVVKGGLNVNVGESRVFIPASLVSDAFEKDLNKYLDQEIEFVLTEFDPQNRRVIGNRRKLVSEQKAAAAQALFENINVGDVVKGTIKNITDFGAFVDLGGADGLLHISEMSWGRVDNPKKLFKVGDEVECFIKELDKETGKIALSLKFDEKNPWINAEEKYAIGTVVKGKVARMTDFGAFIVLEPGIDALLHVSQISLGRIEKPADVLTRGQEIEAKVVDLNVEGKKISLSIKALLKDQQGDSEEEEASDTVYSDEEPVAEAAEESAEEVAAEDAE